MMGPPKIEKGLFITTAKFSQGAKDFANAQHIILVDGQKLFNSYQLWKKRKNELE